MRIPGPTPVEVGCMLTLLDLAALGVAILLASFGAEFIWAHIGAILVLGGWIGARWWRARRTLDARGQRADEAKDAPE